MRFTEIGSVAANDALPGVGSDALFINDNECKICKVFDSFTIACGSEMILIKVVDLVHGGAKEGDGTGLVTVSLGKCLFKNLDRIIRNDLDPWCILSSIAIELIAILLSVFSMFRQRTYEDSYFSWNLCQAEERVISLLI